MILKKDYLNTELVNDTVEGSKSYDDLACDKIKGGDDDRVEVDTDLGENMVERCESDGELLSESVKGESDPD
jgi:hypothetical protein